MPRSGPAKTLISLRLAPPGLEWLDARAKAEGVDRSEMIRILMKYASTNMPKGWR